MSVEKYLVSKEESEYSIIPNQVAQGLAYNLEALGLYLYIFSLPPAWVFYKSHLMEVCHVGVKKLNKLLKILNSHGLLEIAQVKDAQGKFAHFDLRVKNGKSFINQPLTLAQPEGQNCRTAKTVRTEKNSYKENINKENINIKKENKKLICATDVARPPTDEIFFDQFWSMYPRKRDKARARDIWIAKGYDKIAHQIMGDIRNRLMNDHSWSEVEFIPYPSKYLKYERWTDEVSLKVIKPEKENGLERAMRLCLNKKDA